jgi:hypothetical protein
MTGRPKQLRARQQVVAEIDGKQVVVLEGARLPATDPVVRAHPGAFAAPPARKRRRRS